MNIDTFYHEMNRLLKQLSKQDREQALTYYGEIIADSMEDGYSAEEAIARLGNLEMLADNVLAEYRKAVPVLRGKSTGSRVLNIILLILGSPIWLTIFAVIFVLILVVYILLYVPVLVLGVLALAFPLAGIWSIVGAPFLMADIFSAGLFQLGGGIALLGLSILCFFAFYYTLKGIIKATVFMSKKIAGLFRRKGA